MKDLEMLTTLLDADSEHLWLTTLFSLANSIGIEKMLFALVQNRFAGIESAYLHSNYPSSWRKIYDDKNLFHFDPTVAHCFANSNPLIWNNSTFTTQRQKVLYEEAAVYGITSGVTLPIHGIHGEVGMLTVVADLASGARIDNTITHLLPQLALLRDFVTESSRKFVGGGRSKKQSAELTARELECLKWTMAGKTSWETAQILKISEATVNFHLANTRRKLNVTTRRQAIVKAIGLGLLAP